MMSNSRENTSFFFQSCIAASLDLAKRLAAQVAGRS